MCESFLCFYIFFPGLLGVGASLFISLLDETHKLDHAAASGLCYRVVYLHGGSVFFV